MSEEDIHLENLKKKIKETPLNLRLAITIIVLGFVIGIICIGYFVNQIERNPLDTIFDSFNNLGTVLTGTTGLLFTLAGIILFFYTIKQTKDEMIATQDILSRQLAESTFFNLMQNYRNSIYPPIEEQFTKEINRFKEALSNYKNCVTNTPAQFHSFTASQITPMAAYNVYRSLNQVAENLLHIASLVHTNLKSKKISSDPDEESIERFFHKTFYYSLKPDEKFLIGFVSANNFEDRMKMFDFDYAEAYRKANFYFNAQQTGYYPPVKLNFFRDSQEIYIKSLKNLEHSEREELSRKTTLSVEYAPNVKFKGISYYLKYYEDGEAESLVRGFSYLPKSNEFDLSHIITKDVLPLLDKALINVKVKMGFVFEYDEKKYIVYADFLKCNCNVHTFFLNLGHKLIVEF